MINRRQFITLPALLPLSSIPIISEAKTNDKNKLTICLSLLPSSLDPTNNAEISIGEVVLGNILEGLTCINEDGKVLPLLAESWIEAPNKLHYRFKIKPNVLFHDGSSLNADVVAYSFNRCKKLGSKNKLSKTFANIKSIDVIDPNTIDISLNHAEPFFLFRLGQEPAVILHPETADKTNTQPIGTGPYKLNQWHENGNIDLTKWAKYHTDKNIAIEQATFIFISDPAKQLEAITKGEADMLFRASHNEISQVNSNPKYEILSGNSSSKGLIAINNRNKYLSNVLVRRAITHAIDREEFIHNILKGEAVAIGSHFAPTDPSFIDLTSIYEYNPSKAKKLLKQAGINHRLKFDLALPPTPYALEGADLIADYLAAIGIDVTLVKMTWRNWLDQVFTGDFDLTVILHAEPLDYQIYTDPDYYFGYDSNEFRNLVQDYSSSNNPRTQNQIFMQMQRQLTTDAVNAWIYTPKISVIVKRGLKGVQMDYPIFTHDIASMYWE